MKLTIEFVQDLNFRLIGIQTFSTNMDPNQQSRQKLDTFLENKVLSKSKFSKKCNNKSWAPSLILLI